MLHTHLNCMEWSEKLCAKCASVTRQRLRRDRLKCERFDEMCELLPKWRPLCDATRRWRVCVCVRTRQRAGHWAKGPSGEYTWSIGIGCLLEYTCCCYCCSSRPEVVQLPRYTRLTQHERRLLHAACVRQIFSFHTLDGCLSSVAQNWMCMGIRVRLRMRLYAIRCVRTEKHRTVECAQVWVA